jgi:hypothetical protein
MCESSAAEASADSNLWYVGVIVSIIGSCASNGGVNLQKLSIMKEMRKPPPSQRAYVLQPLWFIGLWGVILGAIADFGALGFAAQSLLTPVGGFTIIANIWFARVCLNERLSRKDSLATLLITVGIVAIAASGDKRSSCYTLDQLVQLYGEPAFIGYIIGVSVVSVGVYIFARYARALRARVGPWAPEYQRLRKAHMFAYPTLSGVLGAQSVLFAKSTAELIKSTARGDNQLVFFGFYAIIAAMVFTIVSQLHWLALALKHADALFVIPVFQCWFITVSIIGGGVYFNELDGMSTGAIAVFMAGLVLLLGGIYLLSQRQMGGAPPTKLRLLAHAVRFVVRTRTFLRLHESAKWPNRLHLHSCECECHWEALELHGSTSGGAGGLGGSAMVATGGAARRNHPALAAAIRKAAAAAAASSSPSAAAASRGSTVPRPRGMMSALEPITDVCDEDEARGGQRPGGKGRRGGGGGGLSPALGAASGPTAAQSVDAEFRLGGGGGGAYGDGDDDAASDDSDLDLRGRRSPRGEDEQEEEEAGVDRFAYGGGGGPRRASVGGAGATAGSVGSSATRAPQRPALDGLWSDLTSTVGGVVHVAAALPGYAVTAASAAAAAAAGAAGAVAGASYAQLADTSSPSMSPVRASSSAAGGGGLSATHSTDAFLVSPPLARDGGRARPVVASVRPPGDDDERAARQAAPPPQHLGTRASLAQTRSTAHASSPPPPPPRQGKSRGGGGGGGGEGSASTATDLAADVAAVLGAQMPPMCAVCLCRRTPLTILALRAAMKRDRHAGDALAHALSHAGASAVDEGLSPEPHATATLEARAGVTAAAKAAGSVAGAGAGVAAGVGGFVTARPAARDHRGHEAAGSGGSSAWEAALAAVDAESEQQLQRSMAGQLGTAGAGSSPQPSRLPQPVGAGAAGILGTAGSPSVAPAGGGAAGVLPGRPPALSLDRIWDSLRHLNPLSGGQPVPGSAAAGTIGLGKDDAGTASGVSGGPATGGDAGAGGATSAGSGASGLASAGLPSGSFPPKPAAGYEGYYFNTANPLAPSFQMVGAGGGEAGDYDYEYEGDGEEGAGALATQAVASLGEGLARLRSRTQTGIRGSLAAINTAFGTITSAVTGGAVGPGSVAAAAAAGAADTTVAAASPAEAAGASSPRGVGAGGDAGASGIGGNAPPVRATTPGGVSGAGPASSDEGAAAAAGSTSARRGSSQVPGGGFGLPLAQLTGLFKPVTDALQQMPGPRLDMQEGLSFGRLRDEEEDDEGAQHAGVPLPAAAAATAGSSAAGAAALSAGSLPASDRAGANATGGASASSAAAASAAAAAAAARQPGLQSRARGETADAVMIAGAEPGSPLVPHYYSTSAGEAAASAATGRPVSTDGRRTGGRDPVTAARALGAGRAASADAPRVLHRERSAPQMMGNGDRLEGHPALTHAPTTGAAMPSGGGGSSSIRGSVTARGAGALGGGARRRRARATMDQPMPMPGAVIVGAALEGVTVLTMAAIKRLIASASGGSSSGSGAGAAAATAAAPAVSGVAAPPAPVAVQVATTAGSAGPRAARSAGPASPPALAGEHPAASAASDTVIIPVSAASTGVAAAPAAGTRDRH